MMESVDDAMLSGRLKGTTLNRASMRSRLSTQSHPASWLLKFRVIIKFSKRNYV